MVGGAPAPRGGLGRRHADAPASTLFKVVWPDSRTLASNPNAHLAPSVMEALAAESRV